MSVDSFWDQSATVGWCDEHALPTAECACNIDTRQLIVQRASDIRPRAVTWLWDGRMALGALSLLAGREGLGKSTLAAWIVARITRGQLPGHLHGQPRAVIVAATEDSWEHTLVPRLMAADADLDRVLRVDVQTAEGFATGLHLPRDISRLKAVAERENAALLVLDPLMSRLDSLDTHKDSEVRIALEPLVQMADETRMGILGLIHLNKGSNDPLNAVMGSKAFTAVARSVSTVVADPEDEDERRRLFGTVKNNLGPALPASQVFTVESAAIPDPDGVAITTGRLDWHGEVDTTIKAAMSDPGIGEQTQTDEARDWLTDYLTLHPGITRKEVMRDASKADLSPDAIKRAARKIGIVSKTEGFPRTARWSLPQSEHAQSVQSEQAPSGESVLNAHTAPTGDDLHKRDLQSVQSVQWVQSEHAPDDAAPTDAPTGAEPADSDLTGFMQTPEQLPPDDTKPAVCRVCGEPSIYPTHPLCQESA